MNAIAQAAPMTFPGIDRFVREIDKAVRNSTDTSVCDLRRTLCRLIRADDVQLPECVFEAQTDRYARRELYTSPDLGYSIIAMTWGPNQGTPIHDHCGMWCVEGVFAGEVEVEQFELRAQEGNRFQFRPVGVVSAGYGSAGSLIPPHEYHTIANVSDTDVAVSIHVYSGFMTTCNVFNHVEDEWYERCERQLCLD